MAIIYNENFDSFLGLGFAPAPITGQLDSDVYSITGLSDGDLGFGGTATTGDFARGQDDDGGVTTGGIYAFTVAGNNFFGFQPGGSDLTPGTVTIRVENTSGAAQNEFTLNYDLLINNNTGRANSLNVAVSTDGLIFTPIAALDATSGEAADALGFQSTSQMATFTTDLVGDGGFLFIQFIMDDVSGGGSRDEFGLDNIVIDTGAGAPPALVINEIHADPAAGLPGDANGDGVRNATADEFVEIVNTSPFDVDISGFTISDAVGVRHTFAAGTTLATGAAIVVFGGGAPTGAFGGALVQTATSGALGLNNGGDTVTLTAADATIIDEVTYGGEGGNNQSLTRDPDITGGFVQHSTVADAGGALFSPGAETDGTSFVGGPPPGGPTLTINEIDSDTPGSDSLEFVELYDGGVGNTALDDFVVVFYNGSDDRSYRAFDLDGFSTDANGFFVLGNAGVANVDLVMPNGSLQNGPDAVALFIGAAIDFPNDTAITTTDLIDVVVYGTGDANDPGLLGGFGQAVQFDENANGDDDNESLAAFPDGSGAFVAQAPTPGATNIAPGSFLINEFRISQPGADDDEFIELFGPSAASLDGLTLLAVSGEFSPGQIDFAFDLTGGATDANGLFFIGNAALDTGTFDPGDLTLSGSLFGSPTTFLLVSGFSGAAGDDLDTNDDGVFDTTPFSAIIDSVSIIDGDATPDVNFSSVVIGPDGAFTPAHAFRSPDGGDFALGQFGDLSVDTPGASNPVGANAIAAAIYEIQGASHLSPLVGELIITTGIVTALAGNGFYVQDATGDGNDATSDGVFVFTGGAPGVLAGDEVSIVGTVTEFIPGGAGTANLSVTNISNVLAVDVLSSGNALPAAIVIGAGGRLPPTEFVVNPAELPVNLRDAADLATYNFDTSVNGADFYESLEGQLVTIQNAQAVSSTNRFGEIVVVADQGVGATGLNARGGLQLGENDVNPERIQIDDNLLGFGALPNVGVGDLLGDITGVVDYNFGNFEVLATAAPTHTPSAFTPEVTTLAGEGGFLTIASYNVLNLDPNDADGSTDIANGQFDAIASQIVNNLATPDIIGLQEIQDGNGSATGELSAAATLQTLIDAIVAAGGPQYEFFEVAPDTEFSTGGQPGGNIRNAYLYDPTRVSLDATESFALTPAVLTAAGADPDTFNGTRTPLLATFNFNGQQVQIINNHFSSRGGSGPIFGNIQPFNVGGEAGRLAQAAAVNAVVDSLRVGDPNANIVVLGDFNDFEFGTTQAVINGSSTGEQILFNQAFDIDVSEDRFSFVFDGNSQLLDQFLVTANLDDRTEFDVLQTNAGVLTGGASDHNPLLGRISFLKTISGSPDNDRITGTDNAEIIEGLNGNDRVTALGGDDFITTGDGNDRVDGGAGNDQIDTGDGNDRVNGGDGNDIIDAGNGNNRVEAGAGNDVINTGEGNDRVEAGDGDDVISTGKGNDRVEAGNGDDVISTGEGNDRIDAGAGADIINAGAGEDRIEGGAGPDIFVADIGFEKDTIVDFNPLEDALDLRAFGIQSLADALAFAEKSGSSVIFDFDAQGDLLTLRKVDLDDLSDANFVTDAGAALAAAIAADSFNFNSAATQLPTESLAPPLEVIDVVIAHEAALVDEEPFTSFAEEPEFEFSKFYWFSGNESWDELSVY